MPIRGTGNVARVTGPNGNIRIITGSSGIIWQETTIPVNIDGTADWGSYVLGNPTGGTASGIYTRSGLGQWTPTTAPSNQPNIMQTRTYSSVTERYDGASRVDTRTCQLITSPTGTGVAGRCSNPDSAIGGTDTRTVTGLTRQQSVTPTVDNGGILMRTIPNPDFIANTGNVIYSLASNVLLSSATPTTYSGAPGDTVSYEVTLTASNGYEFLGGDTSTTETGTFIIPSSGDVTIDLTGFTVTLIPQFEFADIAGQLRGQISITNRGLVQGLGTFVTSFTDAEGNSISALVSAQAGQTTDYDDVTTSTVRTLLLEVDMEVPTGFPNEGTIVTLRGTIQESQPSRPPAATTGSFGTDTLDFENDNTNTVTVTANGDWQVIVPADYSIFPTTGEAGTHTINVEFTGTAFTRRRVARLRGIGSTTDLDTIDLVNGTP